MNAQAEPLFKPSPAGQTLSGAEIVVQVLADEGVDVVFGYSGGAILPTYDAVFRYNKERGADGIHLVVPANEQGAGFMAAGFARASGRVGVCLVTSGPGATNTVTPVRDAMADSVPMVVICGQVPTTAIGTDAFQEAPISSIMGSCAKHVFLVTDPLKLEATLRSAFEIARTGRPGPVVVDVPKDIQRWEGIFRGRTGDDLLPLPGYRARVKAALAHRIAPADAEKFASMLRQAKRPLLYVGGGVIHGNASDALRRFSETLGIPVVTTLMGIGAVDTRTPLSLHFLGMHGAAFANYATDDCDFLIAVGARFDDRVAGAPTKFARGARSIAHIDIDAAEINKVKRVHWSHVGAISGALDALLDYAKQHGVKPDYSAWRAHCAELKKTYAMNYDHDSALIQPYAVIEALNRHTQGEAIISTGVGQHQMWAAQYFDFTHPRYWLTSGSMGTMGFGLPSAIGAAFAHPGKTVLDIDGDASIRMNVGELETVTTYDLPIKVVVLNNYGDGMVRQWQRLFYKSRFSATDKSLNKKNFVKAAEADGFTWARRLENKADIESTITDFMNVKGPAFLEVIIDPNANVFPMVPSGKPYTDMMTGDWIPSREAVKAPDEASEHV
ncbi:MAG: biosynthetic-type acetolactate synthase large subunit [Nevskiaceae bacterium]|nr:MAG: biosynthetic-type acetolactate synthase large subunit [Nevskiaceae bacterium]TBR74670.1 MAG: biosynthetic-type acetolactate synthase large subunit [Nevskiaceae bacterium]